MWQIVGYDIEVALLDSSLKGGRLSHAYLFVGPHHVGKMTLASKLAQALNCQGDDQPCGACASCQRIAQLRHADVEVIGPNGKAEISIAQIREMERSASLKPFEGRNRVFIIDGAEQLSSEGANSLLKTLEEPPPNVYIILLAANEGLLLPTVRSRCQRLELRPLPITVVERSLIEQWEATPEQATVLARLSSGCLGWAVSALRDDSVIGKHAERLSALLHLTAVGRAERFAYANQLVSQFSKDRESLREVLLLWVGLWHDLLLVNVGCRDLIINIDQEELLYRETENYNLNRIKGFIESLQHALKELGQNANPRLVLEVLMLNLPRREGS